MPFFLVGGVLPLLNYLGKLGITSGSLASVIAFTLLGLFLVLLAVGMKLGMPRWSLPYLGFFLSMLSLYLFSAVFGTPIYLLFRNFRDQSLLWVDILWGGIFWYGLLAAMLVLVILTRSIPALRQFKKDWTLLCFILYGAIPFALYVSFDEYVGDEPYMFLVFVILAGGAWLYLHGQNEWKRFGILFCSLTLAMFLVAAAKAILIPVQTWPITIDAGLVRSEVRHTLIVWGWFALDMLIPLIARILSRPGNEAILTSQEATR